MKNNFSFLYKLILVGGDTLAFLMAFTIAYMLRISYNPRPIATPVRAVTYITIIAMLLPLLIGTFSLLGLYTRRIYERRPKEALRLLIGSFTGLLLLVSFDFFSPEVVFPAKLIPVYAVLVSFLILWVIRTLLRGLRLWLHRRSLGVAKVVLVGNSETTYWLGKYLHGNLQSGYRVVAVVANKKHIYKNLHDVQFKSLLTAIEATNPDTIIQTDNDEAEAKYDVAINHHLNYQFIPTHEALFTAKHSVELLGAFPIINVHTTPLVGWGRLVKRLMDIAISTLLLIVLSPVILLVTLAMILFDHGDPIYRQRRLTRFNQEIKIFKFRTYYHKYHRMTPEEGFAKLGHPELALKYRQNGDYLENDPRWSPLGKFLRKTSLDEILQLLNVIKGDISLVGPRALEPFELATYENKSLILSVKSGLTGLAQISGRRDISFEERRQLDMYYVQNWSIWLDVQIILRTFFAILNGGAR